MYYNFKFIHCPKPYLRINFFTSNVSLIETSSIVHPMIYVMKKNHEWLKVGWKIT